MPRQPPALHDIALELLAARSPDASICPSEIARAALTHDPAAAPDAWRALMPKVHATVERLVHAGQVELSWKGERRPAPAGPYRIHRPRR